MPLSIKVYTSKGLVGLDLIENTQLSIEVISPFFVENLSEDAYSLPIDIPITDNNKIAFGAPEMLESELKLNNVYFIIDVYFDGFPVLQSAKLNILTINSDFNYTTGEYTCSIAGANSLFGAKVKGVKLNSLQLFSIISFGSASRDFATIVMQQPSHSLRSIISFAPMHKPQYFATDRDDYDNEDTPGQVINNIVFNPTAGVWQFGAPSELDPSTPAYPGAMNGFYARHRTIPFIKLTAVLKALFKYYGYQAIGSFFELEGINDLHIDNNYAIEVYRFKNTDLNRQIDLKNHVPDISIASFLNNVCTAFNLKLTFNNINAIARLDVKQIPGNNKILDLTKYAVDNYEMSEFEDMDFAINWSFDTSDEMVSAYIKEHAKAKSRGNFVTLQALNNYTFNPVRAEGDVAYVQQNNFYYTYKAAEQKWIYYAAAFDTISNNESESRKDLNASALVNWVTVDNANNVDMEMVSSTGPGSYKSFKFVSINNPNDNLKLFIISMIKKTAYAAEVPVSVCRSALLSLSYSEQIIGLWDKLFRPFANKLNNTIVIKITFKGVVEDVDTLLESVIKIKNHYFLIKKMTHNLGENIDIDATCVKI